MSSSELFNRAISASFDAFVELSSTFMIVEWSRRAETLTGWHREDAIGLNFFDTVLSHAARDEVLSDIGSITNGDGVLISPQREVNIHTKDGGFSLVQFICFSLKEMDPEGFIGVWLRDISQERRDEEALAAAYLHDPLTNLPSRTMFMYQLSYALVRQGATDGNVAVLFLGIDRFKGLNESLGHQAGDQALIQISKRLLSILRPRDILARFSGDEFLILCEGLAATATAIRLAKRIADAFKRSFLIGSEEIYTSLSLGIATSSKEAFDAETLLANADAAMYHAKNKGGNRYEVFREEIMATVIQRTSVEASLHRALEKGELRVYFQPVIELKEEHIIGVEALVRWAHPEQGILNPDSFIPTAEETGLIVPIGTWVLGEACKVLDLLATSLKGSENLSNSHGVIEVNLSARQIGDPNLITTVERALRNSRLHPNQLILEITESALMDDPEAALDVLKELKSLGVRLAIDDFGTGFSSLTYLQRFPIDVLKVDKSFISELSEDGTGYVIVKAVIDLAHTLGLEVVAEGVETEDELRILKDLDCDMAQGFYFARPLPIAELKESLA